MRRAAFDLWVTSYDLTDGPESHRAAFWQAIQ